jgi:hypothetical protein
MRLLLIEDEDVVLQSGIERLLGAKVEAWQRVEGGYTQPCRCCVKPPAAISSSRSERRL